MPARAKNSVLRLIVHMLPVYALIFCLNCSQTATLRTANDSQKTRANHGNEAKFYYGKETGFIDTCLLCLSKELFYELSYVYVMRWGRDSIFIFPSDSLEIIHEMAPGEQYRLLLSREEKFPRNSPFDISMASYGIEGYLDLTRKSGGENKVIDLSFTHYFQETSCARE